LTACLADVATVRDGDPDLKYQSAAHVGRRQPGLLRRRKQGRTNL
jgi:hypothetical protein